MLSNVSIRQNPQPPVGVVQVAEDSEGRKSPASKYLPKHSSSAIHLRVPRRAQVPLKRHTEVCVDAVGGTRAAMIEVIEPNGRSRVGKRECSDRRCQRTGQSLSQTIDRIVLIHHRRKLPGGNGVVAEAYGDWKRHVSVSEIARRPAAVYQSFVDKEASKLLPSQREAGCSEELEGAKAGIVETRGGVVHG